MSVPDGILAPFVANEWSRRDATHLLWRTQFGATTSEIDRAHREGLEKTLDRLLQEQEETKDFLEVDVILRETAKDTGSLGDLQAWWLHRMHYGATPLVEKLTLFWHNHFATSFAKVRDVPLMVRQNDLFRKHALGSFRDLLHGMSKDAAMIIWLDGNANRKRHANENFARELMELFSLGEGNYTEDDVKEAARAFTGWHVLDNRFRFNRQQHDAKTKTLFGKTANLDGEDVVNLCLGQNACPRFLAHKLLRAFVLDQPTQAQTNALASRIRERDFSLQPVMRELLSSRLFFSKTARHARIKSPVELTLGACRALQARPNLQAVNHVAGQLGQSLFAPPTVKGWEGGRLWISSASLLQRNNFIHALLSGEMGRLPEPSLPRQRYRELLLAREAPDLVEMENNRRKHLHLVMTLPEFQLT